MHPNNHPPRPAFVHHNAAPVLHVVPVPQQPPYHQSAVHPGIPHVVHGNVVPHGFTHHHAIPIVRHQVVVVRHHAPNPGDLAYQNFANQQELNRKHHGHNGPRYPH